MSVQNTQVITQKIIIAANTADTVYIPQPLEGTWRLKSVSLTDHNGITASDTDYREIDLKHGTTAIATQIVTNVAGLGFTAGTPRAMSLLATAGAKLDNAQNPAAASAWNLTFSDQGTAPAVDMTACIVIEKVA